MKTTILGKEREPVNTYTPEDHEAAGRGAMAREMRKSGIAKEHEYIVGKHGYLVVEYTNGEKSAVKKIF